MKPKNVASVAVGVGEVSEVDRSVGRERASVATVITLPSNCPKEMPETTPASASKRASSGMPNWNEVNASAL